MSEIWYLLRSGPGTASWNMALDEALLEQASSIAHPILRLYSWQEPAATFGYSQRYSEVASWTPLRPLIRRPTGGGLVPHDADWTYSLIFPPGHAWHRLRAEASYQRVHDWISESFRALAVPAELSECCEKPAPGRCFVGAEKFDVLAEGKKIAGAAQKRNRMGHLIQGSIQPPAGSAHREQWETALLASGRSRFGSDWCELKLSEAVLARAAQLDSDKYSSDAFNLRR